MRNILLVAIALFAVAGAAEAAPFNSHSDISPVDRPRWQGPDGVALPFTEDEELLDFLRTAEITKTKVLTSGSNRPLKLRLEKDGIQANAIFRSVDKKRDWKTIYGKTYRNFRDSYLFELAAYEMSRLLGLDNVPPCTIRYVGGKKGTIQLWVENAETMKDRLESGSAFLTNRTWTRQRQMMHIFDDLIHNFDRNQGNMLFDANERLWYIDHTRSFALSTEIENIDKIVWCERGMWEKMKALDKKTLTGRLGPNVDYGRISALIKRRDRLVGHIQALIDERGEASVLFDASPVQIAIEEL